MTEPGSSIIDRGLDERLNDQTLTIEKATSAVSGNADCLPPSHHGTSPNVWVSCLESVEERNNNLARGWKEEIDSLLVFVS